MNFYIKAYCLNKKYMNKWKNEKFKNNYIGHKFYVIFLEVNVSLDPCP